VTYWMGVDKFYVYSGRVETLPCALRQFIFTNINTDQLAQIVCGSNEGYNEVWWFYPTADSLINNRYVIYNYVENTWAYGSLERGYWLDSPLRQFPMAAFSYQKSYVGPTSLQTLTISGDGTNVTITFPAQTEAPVLGTYVTVREVQPAGYNGTYQVLSATTTSVTFANATTAPVTVYGTIDIPQITSTVDIIPVVNTASYPNEGVVTIDFEKIRYTGKTSTSLTGCTRGYDGTSATTHIQYTPVVYQVPNQVMNHEFGNDDRSTATILPIEAYVESSDFDIGDGHNFGFVWRILPDLTFIGSTSNTPAVTLTVKARQNSGTSYGVGDSPTVQETTAIPIELYTGQVYTRIRGRQMAFRLTSSDLGVAWQMGAMRIDIRPDGRR